MSGRRPGAQKQPVTRVGLARVLRGVSQAEMAAFTGMSLASWRRFERGERRATLEVWMNTAYVLGCYLEDLVGDDRLRAWVPVAAHEDPPVDVTDNLWRGEYLQYEEVLERLNEFEAQRSAER